MIDQTLVFGGVPAAPAPRPAAARPAASDSSRLDQYTVMRQLGVGADGTAVLAHDAATDALVELRFLTRAASDAHRRAEIAHHLRLVAVVRHPALREVLASALDARPPRVVLAWPGDARLSDALRVGALAPHRAIAITERLAHAVGALHRVGLFHGRLGPSHVALSEGDAPHVDPTGLRVTADDSSQAGAIDRACIAPELLDEPADASSDVYALGVLLLAMVLGRAPTAAERAGGGTVPSLPTALVPLLSAMLATDRDARPTAAEVCLDLRRHIGGDATLHGSVAESRAPTSSRTQTGMKGAVEPAEGGQLGRFKLEKRLGTGGMGEVFLGRDEATGDPVAIKVLRPELSSDGVLVARFRKEARMLGEVRNPYVANLLEVNVDRGTHYLALEFVSGPSVAAVQADGATRLSERDALGIVADVCRALAEPHRHGIIHRDIKPDNVMFVDAASVTHAPPPGTPRVKLCDFGIARRVVERAETVQLTSQGMMVGTPLYMAPEQYRTRDAASLGPATDVYALGGTLFSLLTGRPPFEGEDAASLMVQHLNEPAPEVTRFAPDVSEPTAQLIARMLAKEPAARPPDAAAVLDAVEAILNGAPRDLSVHPAVPAAAPSAVVAYTYEFDLASSPAALWPYVCNTDRLYRAAGRAPSKFERRGVAPGEVELRGSATVAGQAQKWREYPYEWIEGQRWSALTVFEQGAMKWIAFELALSPRPGGGTKLTYTARCEPRSWIGRILGALELGIRQKRTIGRVLARLDNVVSGAGARAPEVDPFEEPAAALSRAAETRLARGLLGLREDGVDPTVIEHLAAFIRTAPAQEIARIRPLAFARRYGLGEEATVAGLLHAARRGMLTLLWDVLCPLCRIPSGVSQSLRDLATHAHCPACNADFTLDFARSIELIFRVAPALRSSELRTYCVGGPSHSPHVAAQVRLAPGERFVLPLALGPGRHRVRSPQLPDAIELHVVPEDQAGAVAQWEIALGAPNALPASAGVSADGVEQPSVRFRPGAQTLVLNNASGRELVARVERLAPRADALTAARAASMAVFRELFPGEVLAPGRLVAVASQALLITAAEGVAELAQTRGESGACEAVLAHLRALDDCVAAEGGALIKTLGAGVVAAFEQPTAAVRAALAMQKVSGLAAAAGGGGGATAAPGLTPRIAVHYGPMVAATIAERLDYFGGTVDEALTLPALATPGGVVLSATVGAEPEVERVLEEQRVVAVPEQVPARGPGFWMIAIPPRAVQS